MRAYRVRAFVLAGAGAVALIGSAAGAALAHSTNPLATDFAGYEMQPADSLASAGTTFNAPRVTCAPTQESDYFVGEVSFGSASDEVAAVEIFCHRGLAGEQLRADAGAATGTVFPVTPGDRIIATEEVGPMGALAQVSDRTSGDVSIVHRTDTSSLGDLNLEVGLFNVSGDSPVPRFHAVRFRSTQVNGERLGQLDPSAFDMHNPPDPRRVVVTTHLASPFSQGFSVVFKRSS